MTELRRALRGRYTVRAATLQPRDWTALLKTTREKFIVPDDDAASTRLDGQLSDDEEDTADEPDSGDGYLQGRQDVGAGGALPNVSEGGERLGQGGSEARERRPLLKQQKLSGSPPEVRCMFACL